MKRMILFVASSVLLGAGAGAIFSAAREPGLAGAAGHLPEGASGILLLVSVCLAGFFFLLLAGVARISAALKPGGGPARATTLRTVFAVAVIAAFFVVFGLGRDSVDFFARQIADSGVFSLPAYVTTLVAVALVVVVGLVNQGIAAGTFLRAAACALAGLLLLAALYGVAGLPGESTLPPLVFNLVLSLAFSAVVCSPWIAVLTAPGGEIEGE